MTEIPRRILFVRPGGYGDLVLFEPVLRLLKQAWPDTGIGVLIQKAYGDLAPLMPTGIRWMTTECNPYREGPDSNPEALSRLQREILEFAPECLVAACYDKTWLEAVAALSARGARQIGVGPYDLDLISRINFAESFPIEWSEIYTETVKADPDSLDWDKNIRLVRHLLGRKVTAERPQLTVPEKAQDRARAILRKAGLDKDGFAACCPAGTATVAIKAWPASEYAGVVAWLQKTRKVRVLLMGHESEKGILDQVQEAARRQGAEPAVWTGKDGELPVMAALLQCSRFYFGNDTAALHVAAAVDKPVAAIFGGGHYPRFQPAARKAVLVVQPLPCFGCAWNCEFGDAPCVKTIPADEVRKALDALLRAKRDETVEMRVEGGLSVRERDLISKVAEVVRNTRHIPVGGVSAETTPLRRSLLTKLIRQLRSAEADRAARLEVIHRQGSEMAKQQEELRRTLEEVRQLGATSSEATGENTELKQRVADLERQFANSEADRAARLEVIHRQGGEIGKLQEELRRWFEEVRQISTTSFEATTENVKLKQRAVDLEEQFANSEADRTARLKVIEQQGAEVGRLQEELRRSLGEVRRLSAASSEATGENAKLKQRVADLEEQFVDLESARAERLKVIEQQGAEIGRIGHALHQALQQNGELLERVGSLDSERKELLSKFENLLDDLRASEAERTTQAGALANATAELSHLREAAQVLRSENESLSARLAETEADREKFGSRLTAQSQALDEALKSLEAARSRILVLQEELTKIDEHWLARLLKACRLWPR